MNLNTPKEILEYLKGLKKAQYESKDDHKILSCGSVACSCHNKFHDYKLNTVDCPLRGSGDAYIGVGDDTCIFYISGNTKGMELLNEKLNTIYAQEKLAYIEQL